MEYYGGVHFRRADRGPGKARLVLGGVSDEKDDKNSGAGADAGISDAVAGRLPAQP